MPCRSVHERSREDTDGPSERARDQSFERDSGMLDKSGGRAGVSL